MVVVPPQRAAREGSSGPAVTLPQKELRSEKPTWVWA